MTPDPQNIRTFEDAASFERWLSKNHNRQSELWIKIFKKGSGKPSITAAQAVEVVLCWGWIDGLRKGLDEEAFLQRYTPRRARSIWSQVNQQHVARLIEAGRMTEHGMREIDAAKKDGRWAAAYAPMREASPESIPADLREAIAANPKALKTLQQLNRPNLFALGFRVGNMKTASGRAKKIESLVAMLARGETIIPLSQAKAPAPSRKKKGRAS